MRIASTILAATLLSLFGTGAALSGETKDAYQATEQIGTCDAWNTFVDAYGQDTEQPAGFLSKLACMMPGAECEERTLFATLAVEQQEMACRIDPWERTFGGQAEDVFVTAIVKPDERAFIVGYTKSKGAGDVDGWLVHIDVRGKLLWERTFGGAQEDRFVRIAELPDGDALIIGKTKSKGAGDADGWVLRVNANGEVVWERTFGGKQEDYLRSVAVLPDGGALIVGASKSKGSGNFDGWVVRIDGDGTKMWERTYGGDQDDYLREIVALPDGDALIVGMTKSKGAGSGDGWAVRIDGQGEVIWEHTYGGKDDDWFWSVVPFRNGDAMVSGGTFSKDVEGDGWVVRINDKGEPVWDRTYGAYDFDSLIRPAILPDGSALVAGFTSNNDPGVLDGWLVHVDADGGLLRSSAFGGRGKRDGFTSISVLPDGGFLALGYTASKSAGERDGWALRLDADGNGTGIRPGPNPAALVNNATAELTRELAARILNEEGRSFACVSNLTFKEGGFEKAKNQGVIMWKEVKTMRELYKFSGDGIEHRLTGLPEASPWRVEESAVSAPRVRRTGGDDKCLSGKAAIRSIADVPFAPSSGSYKEVEFTEFVSLPPELEPLRSYIYTGYNKSVGFQRTDQGWRAQR